MNQPNPQTPPNQQHGQVPDQRLEQIMERMRTMELENQRLRGQVDFMAQKANPQAPNQQPKPSLFKPEVQDAITQLVQDRLDSVMEKERGTHRQQIGYLADQLDQAKYQMNYGGDKYAKFQEKVDRLRQDYQARQQYITREDALRLVYFEETGKKGATPDPQAPAAPPPQPVLDRYTGQWVDPTTGQPAQPQRFSAAPEEIEQPQQFQPTPPAQGWQGQQQPQQQQPLPMTGNIPPGGRVPPGVGSPWTNPHGQNFTLPNQGMNPGSPSAQAGTPTMKGPISIETSTDADLKAFEDKYGDIAL